VSLSELAELGSFLSGVAVAITLIFLLLQMRQNTKAMSSAALDSGLSDYNRLLVALSGDPSLVTIIRNCLHSFAKQSANDQFRFDSIMSFFNLNGQFMFNQREAGDPLIADQQLQFWAGMLKMDGGREWWDYTRSVMSSDYAAFIDKQIELARPVGDMLPWLNAD